VSEDRDDRDDRDESLEREVDLLADAADGEAIDATQRRTAPSFAAVLARAHRIDPKTVDESALERAADRPVREAAPDPDRMLEALVLAARAEAEDSAARRADRPAPGLRRPGRRRTALVVGALAATSAVAAALVLALSLRADALDREAGRDSGSLAAAQAERDDARGIAVDGPREPAAARTRRARVDRSSSPKIAAPEPAPPPAEPRSEPEPELGASSQPRPEPRPPRNARSRLQDLDGRARAALAAGDLERADELLAKLIQRGGRHRLVEAAFGDRFAIAHRLHSASAQRDLWRAYLQRFAGGRFADDARAGLCRRAPQDAASCWSAYLDDFPRGAYRAQAERALGEDGP